MSNEASGAVTAGRPSVDGSEPKPLLRGRLHQGALVVSIPASVALVKLAPGGGIRTAVTIYVLSLTGLLASSSAYHRIRWSARRLRWIRCLDHSMIYVLIAGTYTAFGVLTLEEPWRTGLLTAVWSGAVVGVALKVIKTDAPIAGALYVVLGWLAILAMPEIVKDIQIAPLLLVIAGGVVYTLGAIILLSKRPNPSPLLFGYHEVWHALVVAAACCHYAAIMMMLRSLP
jgi:hemolysin III